MGGYPSTNIEWVNNSIRVNQANPGTGRQKAIMMTVSSSDKGYEDFRIVDKDFNRIYGDISYIKHGQPQIQAAAILDAGASLYHKRIVSATSTLAHIALDMELTKVETQKTDSTGAKLYLDADGQETTEESGNTPIMVNSLKIKYGTSKIAAANLVDIGNDPKKLGKAIKDTYTDWATADFTTAASIKFPIAVFTETGRGKSKKKIRIIPDYASSKSVSWTKYAINVLEDNQSIDYTLLFSMDPSVIDGVTGENRFVDTVVASRSSQLRCVAYEDSVERMFEYAADITGKDIAYLKEHDILFGCTRKGVPIEGIAFDDTGIMLNSMVGIDLLEGSNGGLGDYPVASDEYEALLTACFDGTASTDIYDINNRRINAIFDANYPDAVKRAIEGLVSFREDIFFFRDLGLDLYTVEDIIAADVTSLKSKFCASYHNSYYIYEPVTKKQVQATIMYHLAQKFVAHEIAGISRPFAGQLYGVTFTDTNIVKDSFNFIPKKLPGFDEIETLNDAKINYLVKYSDIPTMDVEWTSDEADSDFSYINNILAIQKMVRLVRERCPKTRYTFKTADSYDSYKKDVEQVLNGSKSDFDSMTLEFLADDEQKDDKAVYACISVACRDFVDKEYFKVIAI